MKAVLLIAAAGLMGAALGFSAQYGRLDEKWLDYTGDILAILAIALAYVAGRGA